MKTQEYELPMKQISVNKLPSRGIAYPDDVTVSYRAFTFGEMKVATTVKESQTKTMRRILSCIETEGMRVMDLTVLDVFYLGILIKMSSEGGSEFTIPYICWRCAGEDVHKFTQRDLELKELDSEVEALPLTVTMADGKVLEFSPMTIKKYLDLYSGVYSNALPDGKPDGVAPVATLVSNLGFADAYKYITNITDVEDKQLVKHIDNTLMHGIEPLTFKCTNTLEDGRACNADLSIKLEGKEALLKPFREGKPSIKSRICYGNASKHRPDQTSTDGICAGDSTE